MLGSWELRRELGWSSLWLHVLALLAVSWLGLFCNLFLLIYFQPHHVGYRILVSRPGIEEPVPPPMKACILNHWTAREVPSLVRPLLIGFPWCLSVFIPTWPERSCQGWACSYPGRSRMEEGEGSRLAPGNLVLWHQPGCWDWENKQANILLLCSSPPNNIYSLTAVKQLANGPFLSGCRREMLS